MYLYEADLAITSLILCSSHIRGARIYIAISLCEMLAGTNLKIT
jgi:hypothetical protein